MPPMSSNGAASWMVRRAMTAPLSRISGGWLPRIGLMATVRGNGPSVGRSRSVMRSTPRSRAARADRPYRMRRLTPSIASRRHRLRSGDQVGPQVFGVGREQRLDRGLAEQPGIPLDLGFELTTTPHAQPHEKTRPADTAFEGSEVFSHGDEPDVGQHKRPAVLDGQVE